MGKKYYKDWDNFVKCASEFLIQNFHKGRVTLKYRNKLPSYGKLYVTNDNKSCYIKLTEQQDLEKLETFLKGVLYSMANKNVEEKKGENEIKNENKPEFKSKGKKGRKNK